jgi:hypothetical protein
MDQVFPANTGQYPNLPDGKTRNRWFAKAKKAEVVLETLRPYLVLKHGICKM